MLGKQSNNKALTEIRAFYLQSSMVSRLSQDIETLKSGLFEAEQALNTDAKLAASFTYAKNVVIAMPFLLGVSHGNPDKELPSYVSEKTHSPRFEIEFSAQSQGLFPVTAIDAIPPIAEVGSLASAIGHLNALQDIDGSVRSEPLVLQHFDRFYPSISLQIAAKSLNLKNDDIRVNLAESIELGSLEIKTDSQLQMNTFFYSGQNGASAFQVDSFYDVFTGKIDIKKYKDKNCAHRR